MFEDLNFVYQENTSKLLYNFIKNFFFFTYHMQKSIENKSILEYASVTQWSSKR